MFCNAAPAKCAAAGFGTNAECAGGAEEDSGRCRRAAHSEPGGKKTSVAELCPGSSAFLTPGSGIGKKSGSGSGIYNLDHISESLETIFLG